MRGKILTDNNKILIDRLTTFLGVLGGLALVLSANHVISNDLANVVEAIATILIGYFMNQPSDKPEKPIEVPEVPGINPEPLPAPTPTPVPGGPEQ